MSNEQNPDDLRNLWQEQEVEKVTITVDEIRRRANRFERRIYWRNFREYAGAAVALAALTPHLWREHGWRLTPVVLLIAGTLYVMFQLYRRGPRSMPADTVVKAALEFQRQELERQRDALRSVWRWYFLPFVPGFVAVLVMRAVDRGIDARLWGLAIFFAAILGGGWALNQWGARRLECAIQKVKEMEAGDE